jgi:hypothetical protein
LQALALRTTKKAKQREKRIVVVLDEFVMEQITKIISTFPRKPEMAMRKAEALITAIDQSPRTADQIIQEYPIDRLFADLCDLFVKNLNFTSNKGNISQVLSAVERIGNLFGKVCGTASAMCTWNANVNQQLDIVMKGLNERLKPIFAVFSDPKTRKKFVKKGVKKKIKDSSSDELVNLITKERILHLFAGFAFGDFLKGVDDSWIDSKAHLYVYDIIQCSVAWLEVEKETDALNSEHYPVANILGILELFRQILIRIREVPKASFMVDLVIFNVFYLIV